MKKFNSLSVGTRFVIIALFILPFLIGLGLTSVWGIEQLNSSLKRLNQREVPGFYYQGEALREAAEVQLDLRQLVIETLDTKIDKAIEGIREDQAGAHANWEKYKAIDNDDDENGLRAAIEADWQEWDKQIDELIGLAKQDDLVSRRQMPVTLNRALFLGNKVADNLSAVYKLNNKQAQEIGETSQNTYNLVLWVVVGCAIGVTLLILLAGLILAHSMINLTQGMKRLNQELSLTLSDSENKRQYGEQTSKRLNSMSTELKAASNQQAAGSQEQAASIGQIVDTILRLSATAETIAGSAARIDQTTNEVFASAQSVKSINQEALSESVRGEQAMHKTIRTNQQVNEFYNGLLELLTAVQQKSGEIKEVIGLIRSISDETHLLALNAAIEAAGAGEQGERFKVVAHSIKDLSNRSMSSANQVIQTLNNLQGSISQAVSTALEGQQETEGAVLVARETGEVLSGLLLAINRSAVEITKIETAVSDMNELTEEISRTTQQQSLESGQSVEALQNVAIIARQNASSSLQVASTIGDLEELSFELNRVLTTSANTNAENSQPPRSNSTLRQAFAS